MILNFIVLQVLLYTSQLCFCKFEEQAGEHDWLIESTGEIKSSLYKVIILFI